MWKKSGKVGIYRDVNPLSRAGNQSSGGRVEEEEVTEDDLTFDRCAIISHGRSHAALLG